VDRPENKCRSARDAVRKRNYCKNKCKKEKEVDWSIVRRKNKWKSWRVEWRERGCKLEEEWECGRNYIRRILMVL